VNNAKITKYVISLRKFRKVTEIWVEELKKEKEQTQALKYVIRCGDDLLKDCDDTLSDLLETLKASIVQEKNALESKGMIKRGG